MRDIAVIVIGILMIASCVGMTRVQLEAEALETGDWTKVEEAERRDKAKRRLDEFSDFCERQKQILVCNNTNTKMELCGCATAHDLRNIL